jgi:hypothetical protein
VLDECFCSIPKSGDGYIWSLLLPSKNAFESCYFDETSLLKLANELDGGVFARGSLENLALCILRSSISYFLSRFKAYKDFSPGGCFSLTLKTRCGWTATNLGLSPDNYSVNFNYSTIK